MLDVAPPLEGVRVVELGTYVTGPYAAALLAEMGADVIKVEDRQNGDPFRSWGGRGGISAIFAALNCAKRSLAIDVRKPEGRDVVRRIASSADVFIENFRPGTVERFGLGYDELAAVNPRLVYCSISGFGAEGPYRDRPGYDTIGQALSGLLSLLTDLDHPQPMGVSLSDHLTGVFAAYGILGALVGRGATGKGRRVETSLLQATTAFIGENVARYVAEDVVPTRGTRSRTAQVYAFVAGDGQPFVIHLSSPPKFWDGLVTAIGRPELRDDPRFVDRAARAKHYDELRALLVEVFRGASREHWLRALEAADVPAAPINRFDEVVADPQVRALGLFREVVHPKAGRMRLAGSPVRIAGCVEAEVAAPPLLGEHTEAVLREFGYGDAEIALLRESEVI